ncbi:ADP-ribosylation factor-related protein 1 [Hordeum vulgare]|nr:ADP-ribosylation factor-related protein 1 [Hordeum vulgare]
MRLASEQLWYSFYITEAGLVGSVWGTLSGTTATLFTHSSVNHSTLPPHFPRQKNLERCRSARDGDGDPSSPNRRRTVNEDHARYLWENSLSVPWSSVVLPEEWNLNHSRVPIPQVPTDGLERRREIRRRRLLLPLDLKLDPGFAPTSDLWDR